VSEKNQRCAVCNEPTNGGRWWLTTACSACEPPKGGHELGLEDLSPPATQRPATSSRRSRTMSFVAMLCDDEFGGYIEHSGAGRPGWPRQPADLSMGSVW